MSRFVLAVPLLVFCHGGCGEERTLPADSGVTPDAPGQTLKALVSSVVSPKVDPAAALTDMTRTVGVVVAVLGPSESGVYGFGLTKVGSGQVPDGDTIFQIGSVSKALTGLLFASEVAGSSALHRDALVESVLPELKGANGTKKVTLGMLVSHHAGLENMPSNLPKKDPISPATGYTLPALKAYLFGLSAPVDAGKKYSYSNLGSGLLGLCLEKRLLVSGYHALLTGGLGAKLGVTDLWGQVASLPASAAGRLAQGYAAKGNTRVEGHPGQMGVLASAGETLTTGKVMLEMLKVFTGHKASALDAAVAQWIKPIKPLNAADKIAYGLEVQPDTSGAGATYKKSGNTAGGYSAYLAFRRDPKVGVFMMTNVASYPGVKTMATAILEQLTTR